MSTIESFTVDTHEISQLTADLIKGAPLAVLKVEPAVKKAAQNIKKAMIADANKSRHFKKIGRTVTYDIKTHEFFGDATVDAEIGYDKRVISDTPNKHGTFGSAASLAGIAIFGSSKPGGGTVRNPIEALNDEAPNLEAALGAIGDGILI